MSAECNAAQSDSNEDITTVANGDQSPPSGDIMTITSGDQLPPPGDILTIATADNSPPSTYHQLSAEDKWYSHLGNGVGVNFSIFDFFIFRSVK
jgi:hypothetical protein